jgi:CubicO group peptidase (beta-lactamase class C family)
MRLFSMAHLLRVLFAVSLWLIGVFHPFGSVGLAAIAPQANLQPAIAASTLEPFVDQFFREHMAAEQIPGAVVVIVKGGDIILTKGYGYADLEQQRPVIPDRTVFRVGSISKLLTATAVMQQVEQGRLQLHEDINHHLTRFQLPTNYPQPVTLADLLTHTSGIDERFLGIAARSAAEILPIGAYLADHLPDRIMPPGEVLRYSNHGYVLAGYLVEVVTGMSFSQYVEQNILQPLNMHHSSFQLRPDILANLAIGYRYHRGSYHPRPIAYSNDTPSGALNATATDLAQFMIAHLQSGRNGSFQLLQSETIQEMHRQQFTNHPQLPGQTYGFYEWFQNGQRALMHDGELVGFKSTMVLLPDHDLGFFVAYNNETGSLQDKFTRAFLDRYYPPSIMPASTPADTQPSPQSHIAIATLRGRYRYVRYPRHTIDKLAAVIPGSPLFAPEFVVKVDGDTLTIGKSHWRETEPLLFQQRGDTPIVFRSLTFDTLGFRVGPSNQINYLCLGKYAFEKLKWYQTTFFHLCLFFICEFFFFIVFLLWLSQFHHYLATNKWLIALKTFPHPIQRLLALVSILNVGFPITFVLGLTSMDLYKFAYGLPLNIAVLLCIPLLSVGLTISVLVFGVLSWRDRHWSTVARWYYGIIVITAFGFIGLLNQWNLLGFRA